MTDISPHLRLHNDALSSQIDKGGPIEKPERQKTGPKGLARSAMKRKPSKLKRSVLGHASREQKAKVARQGVRFTNLVTEAAFDFSCDPMHVTPRGIGGCDHEDCVIGAPRSLHEKYDRGELDILPYLTLEEQAHAVSHLGILGALKRTTGDNYIPERT